MNLTLLTNYDAASALAVYYIRKSLPSCQIKILYTRAKKGSTSKRAPALTQLAQFELSQLKLHRCFEDENAQQVSNINQGQDLENFLNGKPDLVLSVRHMTILKDVVIRTPRFGVINLHSGLLPGYQGVMATFWAMKNQENASGTTCHSIVDSSIDTGPILATSHHQINYEKSYFWNTMSLYRSGCQNLVNLVKKTATSESKVQGSLQSGDAHYYSFPSESDIENVDFMLFETIDSIGEFI